jgi:hypothetical protein
VTFVLRRRETPASPRKRAQNSCQTRQKNPLDVPAGSRKKSKLKKVSGVLFHIPRAGVKNPPEIASFMSV